MEGRYIWIKREKDRERENLPIIERTDYPLGFKIMRRKDSRTVRPGWQGED